MLAFFCLGARYRPWRYFAALHSRVFGDGAAPRRTCCSPQPRQHSVFRASGGGVLQVLPSVPFFCGEGGSYLVRGESRRSSMARSSRMRSRATGSGNILARCVLGGLAVARFRRGASPGGNPWQFFRPTHPESGLGRKTASSRQDSRAMHPKTGWLWQDMRAMRPKCPANRRRRIHRAKILPGRGAFRCAGPSNHARRANLAIQRRRSALAPATPAPPNSASCPQTRRRSHGSAPPTAFAVPAAATPQTLPHPTAPRH